MDNHKIKLELVLLSTDLTVNRINTALEKVDEVKWSAFCVPSFWVKKVSRDLGTSGNVIAAVGYPAGYQMTETKIHEIELAIHNGAREIALTLNLSAFKSNLPWVKIELAKCAQIIHQQELPFSVILPYPLLNAEELVALAQLCRDTGVDHVIIDGLSHDLSVIESIGRQLPEQLDYKLYGNFSSIEVLDQITEADIVALGCYDPGKLIANTAS